MGWFGAGCLLLTNKKHEINIRVDKSSRTSTVKNGNIYNSGGLGFNSHITYNTLEEYTPAGHLHTPEDAASGLNPAQHEMFPIQLQKLRSGCFAIWTVGFE